MSEEKAKLERIVELLMSENNTLKAALLESERRLDNGLTMRDHFAGLAMQGLLAADAENNWNYEACAENSYKAADAMLKAREVGNEPVAQEYIMTMEGGYERWVKRSGAQELLSEEVI